MAKCYVVTQGRRTGIFRSWAECHAHKGFSTMTEAEKYFREVSQKNEASQSNDMSQSKEDTWEGSLLPPTWFAKLTKSEQTEWTNLKKKYALIVQEATTITKLALQRYQGVLRTEALETRSSKALGIARDAYERADENQSTQQLKERGSVFSGFASTNRPNHIKILWTTLAVT